MPDYTNITSQAAVVKLVGDASGLISALGIGSSAVARFASRCTDIGRRLNALGSIVSSPFLMAVQTFADFDDKMRSVQAVTASTGEAFNRLTEQAKQLGASTSYTAGQVADGMAALGRMGFDSSKIQSAIKPMMDLATSTDTELATAAEIASNNMAVFGINASQASKVADILAITANSSAQTLTDLGEALKTAGPIAVRSGQSLEQVAAQLGVLANMGIRGAMAGTALSRSYKRMADPTVREYLKSLGVQATDTTGNLRDMATVFAEIAHALADMPNAERLSALEHIFEARGSLGGGSLGVNTEGIDQLLEKYREMDGYARKAAETKEMGIGGAFRSLASALEGVNIAIGGILKDTLIPWTRAASKALLGLINIISQNRSIVTGLAGMSFAFLGIGKAISFVGIASGSLNNVIGSLVLLTNPVALFFSTLAAGCAAAIYHFTRLQILENELDKISSLTMKAKGSLLDFSVENSAKPTSESIDLEAAKIRETIELLEKERELKKKIAGSKAVSEHFAIDASYEKQLDALYKRLREILDLKEKLDTPPKAPAVNDCGPSAVDAENARKRMDELDKDMLSSSDKELTNLQEQSEEYKKQVEILKQRGELLAKDKENELDRLNETLAGQRGRVFEDDIERDTVVDIQKKIVEDAEEEMRHSRSGISHRQYRQIGSDLSTILPIVEDETTEYRNAVAERNKQLEKLNEVRFIGVSDKSREQLLEEENHRRQLEYDIDFIEYYIGQIDAGYALGGSSDINAALKTQGIETGGTPMTGRSSLFFLLGEKQKELEASGKKLTELEEMISNEAAKAIPTAIAAEIDAKTKELDDINQEMEAIIKQQQDFDRKIQERRQALLNDEYKRAGIFDIDADAQARWQRRSERSEQSQERQRLDAIRQEEGEDAFKMEVSSLFTTAQEKLANAINEYKAFISLAQSSGSESGEHISAGEKAQIDILRQAYEKEQARVSYLQNIADNIGLSVENAEKSVMHNEVLASFNTDAVSQMVLGLTGGDAADETRKNTARTNELLGNLINITKENSWSLT